jgi:DNA-binding NtrC family response regulator
MTGSHFAGKAMVLIVEDEPLILMGAVDIISDAGFNVAEASNADVAVSFLEAGCDIRVVFTDINMPGTMDGLELAALVRHRWPPVEIIVTSGRYRIPDSDLPVRGIFLPKPYDHDDVVATLRRMAVLH